MKVKVAVGDVSVVIHGATLSPDEEPEPERPPLGFSVVTEIAKPDEPDRAPLGFSVVTEIAKPEEPDLSEYFED